LVLALSVQVHAQAVEEWVARYSGPGDNRDFPTDVVVDNDGNVCVTGYCFYYESGKDYLTIKYDGNGTELWTARYNGYAALEDEAYSMTLDDNGNVYVTGWSYQNIWNDDIVTIKYNPDGVEQWAARYDGPAEFPYDHAKSVAVDQDGNVYVAGESEGIGSHLDITTVKYDSDGVEQWVARWTSPGEQIDGGIKVLIDHFGDIIVLGYGRYPTMGDWVTIKYDPDGVEQWSAVYNGAADGYDRPGDMALDENGNIYVTGHGTIFMPHPDYVTIKYNPGGVEQWRTTYSGPLDNYDSASGIAVSSSGDVYVTGESSGLVGGLDLATIKYNTDGIEQWVARYDGPGHDSEIWPDVAVDDAENVVVTGSSTGISTGMDYVTIQYDSCGAERWIARYDGPASVRDQQNALTLDANGNVYITGESEGIWTFRDYATIKYSQVDADVEVALTPYGAPIQIPAAGGMFEYNLEIENPAADTVSIDVWCEVEVPFGNVPVMALGPISLELPGGLAESVDRTGEVPGRAPFGTYTVNAYAGSYPNIIWDRDSFTFEKLMTGDGVEVDEWAFGGDALEELTDSGGECNAPLQFELVGVYPNPFNASTTFRLELAEAGNVTLEVFDVGGRSQGSPLQDRVLEAGVHEIPFDGAELASGVYIYLLKAGDFKVGGKVLLLK
jgi:uncharacterized delta-60 repeat protein